MSGSSSTRTSPSNDETPLVTGDAEVGATVTIYDEYPIAVSWEDVLLRGSALDVGTRRVLVAHPILDFDKCHEPNLAPAGHSATPPSRYVVAMGFNPFRDQKRSTTDIVLVVVFVVLTLAVVAWGFFG